MDHNRSCALVVLQDRRNIENTSTRETVSVHFTVSKISTDMPDDGVSDDHSVAFRLVEGSEVVPGGDLKGLRWQRGRGPRLGLGSRLPLLVHSGSLASWHRSKGGQGRSRPGCTGPVQRNTRSRGGGILTTDL